MRRCPVTRDGVDSHRRRSPLIQTFLLHPWRMQADLRKVKCVYEMSCSIWRIDVCSTIVARPIVEHHRRTPRRWLGVWVRQRVPSLARSTSIVSKVHLTWDSMPRPVYELPSNLAFAAWNSSSLNAPDCLSCASCCSWVVRSGCPCGAGCGMGAAGAGAAACMGCCGGGAAG